MNAINNLSLSPAQDNQMSILNFHIQVAEFDESKHLTSREKQYCDINFITHGIYVIRETEEGWWRESIDFKKDIPAQIKKLKNDTTVACGWVNANRFNELGGWHDPS